MPILAYCITDASVPVTAPEAGVAGERLTTFTYAGFQCFVSGFSERNTLSGKESALAFHQVLQEIFNQTAIIPFRYPTTVDNETALRSFLEEQAVKYQAALERLRGMVQMEIRVSWNPDAESNSAVAEKQSGGDYLRAKLRRESLMKILCAALRSCVDAWVSDWRQRPSSQGVRIFALVARSAVENFKSGLARMPVGPEWSVRASGPWPATEFIEKNDVGR
jgi:hypothetical protein